MNWLAHLYLSGPEAVDRVGGLLPDLLGPNELASLPGQFRRGIEQHRIIDAFTDAHPVFLRSVQRFDPPFRRFGGILTDVFYDHFLARDWKAFAMEPREEFIGEFYRSLKGFRADLPAEAYARLEQMRAGDWLSSYHEVAGIAAAVERIGLRMRRPVELRESIAVLEQNYELFHGDFMEFFPEMWARLKAAEA